MDALERVVADVRAAGRELAGLSTAHKNAALVGMAEALTRRSDEILRDGARDLENAKALHSPPAVVDRLYLDADRIGDMADGIRRIAALPDPVGRLEGGRRLPNGLEVERRRVPLGVVAVVDDARPNAIADAAALCVKSGNAVILRGSRIALRSNRIIAEVLAGALIEAHCPRWGVALLGPDREELRRLVGMAGMLDLVVARGGPELRRELAEYARVPVIDASSGNNHVYVHSDADVEMAVRIAVSSKVQRPGVSNAAETLLVHRDIAEAFLPPVVSRLRAHGVELRVSAEVRELLGPTGSELRVATDPDYDMEFLDLVMAVRVVDSLDSALAHIDRHGSGHSEAIVTSTLRPAREFRERVDSAVVCVNASTRFTDGGELGMGAEIGVSTQKLHARGPIGLEELTTYKYLVTGDGHVR